MERRIVKEIMLGENRLICIDEKCLIVNLSTPSILFYRLFGTKCDKCGSSFSKTDFVMRAKTKIYHIHCFQCSACARQLLPGECQACTMYQE